MCAVILKGSLDMGHNLSQGVALTRYCALNHPRVTNHLWSPRLTLEGLAGLWEETRGAVASCPANVSRPDRLVWRAQ